MSLANGNGARQTDPQPRWTLNFPAQQKSSKVTQDAEWFELVESGRTQRLRLHDYANLFRRPGLYEHVFYDCLQCTSPKTIARLLEGQLGRLGARQQLRVLDVGAGNGMVAEEVRRIGAVRVVGCDILPEAEVAAQRDRPGVYDDYVVADLTALSADEKERIAAARPNCMTVVAALGFGDIPTAAFVAAYNAVEDGGLVCFNIKDEFVSEKDGSGFAQLVKGAAVDGAMEIVAREEYRHRLSVTGEELCYVAFVAVKRAPLGALRRQQQQPQQLVRNGSAASVLMNGKDGYRHRCDDMQLQAQA